jgi:hypothetical protein
MLRLLRIAAWAVIAPFVALLTVIGILFLHFAPLPWPLLGTALAAIFGLAVVVAFILLKPRVKALAVFAVLYGGLVLWFSLIPASNDRQWQPDVARTVFAEIDGDLVTIQNVRNFRYRSIDDYEEAWEARSYDLSGLRTLDIFFSYWGPTNIAHTMLSFGFEGGTYLCVSVEVRKEIGETYAPMRSFFKNFEIIYLLADERDLVALRTNHRGEDVYLFPRPFSPAQIRALLEDILARANGLHEKPEYYRTVRDNCTTSLIGHINKIREEPVKMNLSVLMNGWLPRLAYDQETIPNDAPFEEVMRRFAISERGRAYGDGPDYSSRIREGVGDLDLGLID